MKLTRTNRRDEIVTWDRVLDQKVLEGTAHNGRKMYARVGLVTQGERFVVICVRRKGGKHYASQLRNTAIERTARIWFAQSMMDGFGQISFRESH